MPTLSAPAVAERPAPGAPARIAQRSVALDAFRGLTIAAMILVNTPGSWAHIYGPLRHAAWHGATPTDLIFPFFLFVVGTAMWFSFSKFDHQLSPALGLKVARRVALIFLIGLLLNAFPFTIALGELRIMGVLQRIALAFGLASVLCLTLDLRKLVAVSVAILLGYWALLWGLGGADPYALETSVARRVDLAVLGESHVWRGFGIPFEPEGLLSTIPAAVTVVMGYLTGRWITTSERREEAVLKMFLAGTAAIAVGLAWDLAFPINKPLWTSSYVLYTGGIAMAMLAWFIWLIDIRGHQRWTMPLRVYGMNPLFAFVLSVVIVRIWTRLIQVPVGDGETITFYAWLFTRVFEPLAGSLNGSLLFAVAHVVLIWLIVWPLYRKNILIKI